jgi:hypothetical protein
MKPGVVVGILTMAFALLCVQFVWQANLATFADDSVSYLIAAQAMSPWQHASAPVLEAFHREAPYPPLYPLLLALAGAGANFSWAHALSALLVAAWLPIVYLLAARWLQSRWTAVFVTLATALLPALWINAKGILSEPLYGLLLLGLVYVLEVGPRGRRGPFLAAALLSGLVLTRSAGLALVLAYFVWAWTPSASLSGQRFRRVLPAAMALLAYAAWVAIRPVESTDTNAAVLALGARSMLGSPDGLYALAASVLRQLDATAEGWIGSLMVYWVPGRPVPAVLAGLLGALALAGCAVRIHERKADGWITAGYLLTFLVWPFYDQMGRFLFPILPVLLAYMFYAAGRIAAKLARPVPVFAGLVALALFSLEGPALAFVYQRARIGGESAAIVDWYRTPGIEQARTRARVHLALFADMDEISRRTPAQARVMWVAPGYIALLAQRRGLRSPDPELPPAEYRQKVASSGAQYLFLSEFHPRDTVRDTAWRAGLDAMIGHAKVVHSRTDATGTRLTSLLLELQPEKAGAR